jgi:outer membrane protein OmpA-like peptidoglycan-associated protein
MEDLTMQLRIKLVAGFIGLTMISMPFEVWADPSQSYCNLMLSLHFPISGCAASAASSETSSLPAKDQAILLMTIPFMSGNTNLTDPVRRALDTIVTNPKNNDGTHYHIIGHASRIGSAAQNDALSLSRAKAVATYLEQRGIKNSQLTVEGRGFNDPLPQVDPKSGTQRRVEIFKQ